MTNLFTPNLYVPPERLETSAFVVRSYMPGDGSLLAKALNDSYDHLRTYMLWAKEHTTKAEAEHIARGFRARYVMNKEFVMAILSPDETQWLGSTGFHLRGGDAFENRAIEIGMWIHVDAAGQGLGTKVLKAQIEWAFSSWEWERILWRSLDSNIASRRTAEKAGLILEGVSRGETRHSDGRREDMLRYSILKEEWLKSQK